MVRPRHPHKDLESLIRAAEAQGWTANKGKKYFKLKCSCPKKHLTTVVLTPSGSRYLVNKRAWFKRQSCWEEA